MQGSPLISCLHQLPILLTSLIWLDPRNKTGYWLVAAAVISKYAFTSSLQEWCN